MDLYISSQSDLENAIEKFGIVPYFKNSLKGFSIEENVDPAVWFGSSDGVWEWKGPVIRRTGCAYGKFFENKAAFVSREVFCHLANFRRDGYDFDARFDDGLASFKDSELYGLVSANAPILSKTLRAAGGYVKGGKKGFDTVLNRLMHQCYVITDDFIYLTDKNGAPYGWGLSSLTTPELFMGADFSSRVYSLTPEQSFDFLLARLKEASGIHDDKAIRRFLV